MSNLALNLQFIQKNVIIYITSSEINKLRPTTGMTIEYCEILSSLYNFPYIHLKLLSKVRQYLIKLSKYRNKKNSPK